MPLISYNSLTPGTPDQDAVIKEIAEDINAVVQSSAGDVRGRIGTILRLPINQTDANVATGEIKAIYEQLTKKEHLVTAFETAERIALYQADVVEKLRTTFTHNNVSYSVMNSIGEMRRVAREAMAAAPHQQAPAPEAGAENAGEQTEQEEHHGEDKPPEGGVFKKFVARPLGVAGLTTAASAGVLAATQGLPVSTVPVLGALMNVPALQSAASGLNALAAASPAWISWLPTAAAWVTPGLAVGATTVGGLWALGKIREGADRREFYKKHPTGRFPKKTFLQNVGRGVGLLLSPLKIIPAIPRYIGSAANWGMEKIGNTAKWIGENTGTVVKGAGVGTLVGGTLFIVGALGTPAAALIVGAGTAATYMWLNRKSAGSSAEPAVQH